MEANANHPPRVPLQLAALKGDVESLRLWRKWLLRGWNDQDETENGDCAADDEERLRGRDRLLWPQPGETPVHYAARAGDAGSLGELLAAGAVTHSPWWRQQAAAAEERGVAGGVGALQLAAAAGHLAAVKLLLRHIPGRRDLLRHQVEDALSVAGGAGVALVLALAGPQGCPSRALLRAARAGRAATVSALLRVGANPRVTDKCGVNALHYAAGGGHVTCVRALLRRDGPALVSALCLNQRTPLHWAAASGSCPALALLVAAGADVSCCSQSPHSPLHDAAINGHAKATAMLLEAGAAVGCVDEFMRTPLHLAAFAGGVDVVLALLAGGASSEAKDCRGRRPLDFAEQEGHEEVVKLLQASGSTLVRRS